MTNEVSRRERGLETLTVLILVPLTVSRRERGLEI